MRYIHSSTTYQSLHLSLFSSLFHSHQQPFKTFVLESPSHFLHSQQATLSSNWGHQVKSFNLQPHSMKYKWMHGFVLLLSLQDKISLSYSRPDLSKAAQQNSMSLSDSCGPTDTWHSKSHISWCRLPLFFYSFLYLWCLSLSLASRGTQEKCVELELLTFKHELFSIAWTSTELVPDCKTAYHFCSTLFFNPEVTQRRGMRNFQWLELPGKIQTSQ